MHPGHPFPQTGEHRLSLARINAAMCKLVCKNTVRCRVTKADRTVEAARCLMRCRGHRPVAVPDVTQNCHESLLILRKRQTDCLENLNNDFQRMRLGRAAEGIVSAGDIFELEAMRDQP